MKVGDIVKPSSRLLSQKGFKWLCSDSLGLIVNKRTYHGHFQVLWYMEDDNTRKWTMRREWIKHAKAKK